jgi:hypothetical protein
LDGEQARRVGLDRRAIPGLSSVRLFNAVFPAKEDERAFEWLVNRLNRTMETWDSRTILICDQGKEATYTRLTRRMGVYNPIPSRFGVWMDGAGVSTWTSCRTQSR